VQKEAKDSQKRNEAKVKENTNQAVASNDKPKKLSYKEQKELEQLSSEIETLTAEKDKLEAELSSGTLTADKLMEASNRIGEIMELLDEKELRWLELSC
jgi:ATP-binding cassette subfamily F protein uup